MFCNENIQQNKTNKWMKNAVDSLGILKRTKEKKRRQLTGDERRRRQQPVRPTEGPKCRPRKCAFLRSFLRERHQWSERVRDRPVLRRSSQMAKYDPFLSSYCAGVEGVWAQSMERKGSNFATWLLLRKTGLSLTRSLH